MNPVQSPKNMLVDAEGLLNALFDKKARPSLRWLRTQQKIRSIPHIKIGRMVRFDVERVREALNKKFTIAGRAA
jgi:hypothetical protein